VSSPGFYYLDACTTAGWCCASVAEALPIDVACGAIVDGLLARDDSVIGVSELTILESHNVLSRLLRSTDAPHFDNAWFEGSLDRIMAHLASRRVTVIASPPKAAEHALVLVTVASRDHRAKLKAWDAVHIITAAGWARALGERVTVVTADGDFRRFFDLRGHFSALLDLQQVTA
jgi:hypothetical protein